LSLDGETVRWNPEAEAWLDVHAFDRLSQDEERLDQAVALYQDDLLQDLYDDWLLPERDRWRERLLTCLGAAELYSLSVSADVLQKTKCDPCLLGTWELNKDGFIGYMSAPFIPTPGLFESGAAQGTWRYTFDQTGTLAAMFDFAFSYTLHQGSEVLPIDANMILTFDGPAQALYWAPENGTPMMQAVQSGFHAEQHVTINGQEAGGGPLDLFSPFPAQGTATPSIYACSPSKLFLTGQAAENAGLPAIEYDRVPGS
jgi:hypothetical protein